MFLCQKRYHVHRLAYSLFIYFMNLLICYDNVSRYFVSEGLGNKIDNCFTITHQLGVINKYDFLLALI